MGVPAGLSRLVPLLVLSSLLALGCECSTPVPDEDGGTGFEDGGGFSCVSEDAMTCLDNKHYSCTRNGEFLSTVVDDCDLRTDGNNICVLGLGCRVCRPDEVFCADGDVVQCNSEGTGYDLREDCDISAGFVCDVNT